MLSRCGVDGPMSGCLRPSVFPRPLIAHQALSPRAHQTDGAYPPSAGSFPRVIAGEVLFPVKGSVCRRSGRPPGRCLPRRGLRCLNCEGTDLRRDVFPRLPLAALRGLPLSVALGAVAAVCAVVEYRVHYGVSGQVFPAAAEQDTPGIATQRTLPQRVVGFHGPLAVAPMLVRICCIKTPRVFARCRPEDLACQGGVFAFTGVRHSPALPWRCWASWRFLLLYKAAD